MWKGRTAKSHKTRTGCCCAFCGAPREHETGTSIVTMQYGDEDETCMVYQAAYPQEETCMSVMKALIMANYAHVEDAGSHLVGSPPGRWSRR